MNDSRRARAAREELVAQLMKSLAETFAVERAKPEVQVEPTEEAPTEDLRVAASPAKGATFAALPRSRTWQGA